MVYGSSLGPWGFGIRGCGKSLPCSRQVISKRAPPSQRKIGQQKIERKLRLYRKAVSTSSPAASFARALAGPRAGIGGFGSTVLLGGTSKHPKRLMNKFLKNSHRGDSYFSENGTWIGLRVMFGISTAGQACLCLTESQVHSTWKFDYSTHMSYSLNS